MKCYANAQAASFGLVLGLLFTTAAVSDEQTSTGENALPNWKPIEGQTIDAILITHAHQDHIGGFAGYVSAVFHRNSNIGVRQRR